MNRPILSCSLRGFDRVSTPIAFLRLIVRDGAGTRSNFLNPAGRRAPGFGNRGAALAGRERPLPTRVYSITDIDSRWRSLSRMRGGSIFPSRPLARLLESSRAEVAFCEGKSWI